MIAFTLVVLSLSQIIKCSPELAEFECLESKCWCEKIGKLNMNIECSKDLNFNQQMKNYLKNQKIKFFLIKNVLFPEKKDLFYDLEISELVFENVQFTSIDNRTFFGIKGLKKLFFQNMILPKIENGVFFQLELVDIDFKNCSIDDKFMNENYLSINELSHIGHFTMSHNKLVKLNQNWFKNLKIYFLFNLSFNMIEQIDVNFFKSMTELERLNLNFNKLKGCFDQTALLPLKKNLVRLTLSSNQLTCVTVFERFLKLRILDLSNNSIEVFDYNVFQNLISLNVLNLNHNKIKYICSDCFAKNLLYLRLADNFLKRIPSIKSMSSLILFDLKNQNGQLKQLDNYQFDRKDSFLNLKIHLEQNDVTNFAHKSFCTKYNSYLDNFTLSYQTFLNMFKINKCLFNQLNYKSNEMVRLFIDDGHLINTKHLNDLCTCDFINFLKLSNILISGLECNNFVCKSNQSLYFDQCAKEKMFTCNKSSLNLPTVSLSIIINFFFFISIF